MPMRRVMQLPCPMCWSNCRFRRDFRCCYCHYHHRRKCHRRRCHRSDCCCWKWDRMHHRRSCRRTFRWLYLLSLKLLPLLFQHYCYYLVVHIQSRCRCSCRFHNHRHHQLLLLLLLPSSKRFLQCFLPTKNRCLRPELDYCVVDPVATSCSKQLEPISDSLSVLYLPLFWGGFVQCFMFPCRCLFAINIPQLLFACSPY